MPKTKKQSNGSFLFYCLGCGNFKSVDSRWTFNNDFENPTFTPSILTRGENKEESLIYVCHSFITNGKIKYLEDCTHELRGQEIDLPNIEEKTQGMDL